MFFYNNLPLFNKKDSLEDNYSFKFTSSPSNAKFSFSANHTNGKRGKLEFAASETLTKYYNTELGYKVNSKPGVELSAKLTDSLIPLNGAGLTLKLAAEEREETASVTLSHVCKHKNLSLTLSHPLPTRAFNLSVSKEEEKTFHNTVSGELVVKVSQNRNYFVGLQGKYKVPIEEKGGYEVKAVLANKGDNFEGGVYAGKSVDKESYTKMGAWASTQTGDVSLASNFSYDFLNKKYVLDNFASFPGSEGTNYLLGLQVFPKTSLSFGVQRSLGKSTKFTVAYSSVIGQTEENFKRSGLRFGVELTN